MQLVHQILHNSFNILSWKKDWHLLFFLTQILYFIFSYHLKEEGQVNRNIFHADLFI